MTAKSWISNDTDSIVEAAQRDMLAGKCINNQLMSKLMDMISGVEGYSPYDMSRQGIIAKFFHKEISKSAGVLKSANYILSLEDLVSIFWENVLVTIPTAKRRGDTVAVRSVNGSSSSRPTNSNAVYYIRSQSITKTRNYINSLYAKMLVQSCDECFYSGPPNKEEVTLSCPKCGETDDTYVFWPDGNMKYRAKKMRACRVCASSTWKRKFEYKCSKCKSDQIFIGPKNAVRKELHKDDVSIARSAEDEIIDAESELELVDMMSKIRARLPKNPANKQATSRTMELFDIITDKSKSIDMCVKCRLSARRECSVKCGAPDCGHAMAVNGNDSCGAQSFSLARCVNYSKKIGEHTGCSASLVARRMKQIRATTAMVINEMKGSSDLADKASLMMEDNGAE